VGMLGCLISLFLRSRWCVRTLGASGARAARPAGGRGLEPYLVSVVGRPELWKPWANDPESFERAVLANEASVGILPTSCVSLLRGSSVATGSSHPRRP
jgi:hypothetical protein